MAVLYIVATPIGNLKDISQRALDVLRQVDMILCEDTRVTKRLLDHYGITVPTLSYHQHSKLKRVEYIIQFLKEEKSLALVSDAGTPGIADPGGQLVSKVYSSGFKVVSIPGPSALVAAASISGFSMDRFIFLGFPPVKKKRLKFFEEVANSKYPVVFYESPYRIIKTLNELNLLYTKYKIQNTQIVVCRELTKKFETIYRGNFGEVINEIEKGIVKGEFAIVVGK